MESAWRKRADARWAAGVTYSSSSSSGLGSSVRIGGKASIARSLIIPRASQMPPTTIMPWKMVPLPPSELKKVATVRPRPTVASAPPPAVLHQALSRARTRSPTSARCPPDPNRKPQPHTRVRGGLSFPHRVHVSGSLDATASVSPERMPRSIAAERSAVEQRHATDTEACAPPHRCVSAHRMRTMRSSSAWAWAASVRAR